MGVGTAWRWAWAFAAFAAAAAADDWPQWMGPNRDGVWPETGIVEKLPPQGPPVRWRKPLGGGYAGPAVAGGRVYVADYLTKDSILQENFQRGKLTGVERLQCLDAATGEPVWKKEYPRNYTVSYPSGPRCTPTVHGGKVYALGAEGDFFCLDAARGTVQWEKFFPRDYATKSPIWGYCSHPLVDGQKVICVVGAGATSVAAFDKDTGKQLWAAVPSKEPGYSPPTIIEAGGVRQLLIWTGEKLHGLDPETGKVHWEVPLAPRYGMSVMAPRKDGDLLFAGAVFGTCVALRLDRDKPAVAEAWRGKDKSGLYPMNITPFADAGVLYGCDQPGQFRAVEMATGKSLWESWLPVAGKPDSKPIYCGTAFTVRNGPRCFLFNENGELLIAEIDRRGYREISRAKILEATGQYQRRAVVWSHPAFANRTMYARNDEEIVAVSLAK